MPLIVVDVEGMPAPCISPARAFAAVVVHPDPKQRYGFCARLHGKPLGRSAVEDVTLKTAVVRLTTFLDPLVNRTAGTVVPLTKPTGIKIAEPQVAVDPAWNFIVMENFAEWIADQHDRTKTPPIFLSDNPAFDWQHINHLFHFTIQTNPFGHSARRIGDFYAGLANRWRSSSDWKQFRVTKHTHHPLDDAHGNVEAFIEICRRFDIEVPK